MRTYAFDNSFCQCRVLDAIIFNMYIRNFLTTTDSHSDTPFADNLQLQMSSLEKYQSYFYLCSHASETWKLE